jgi:hypothetical protein
MFEEKYFIDVIEGKIGRTRRRRRRCKKLSNDFKARNLKYKTLDCTVWRPRFESGYRPVSGQTVH